MPNTTGDTLAHTAADALDELAAFGTGSETGEALASGTRALTEMVERNPIPSVLAAAAAGAGLMALVSLMARRDPEPLAPVPLVSPRAFGAFDYDALKQQIADLADRLTDRLGDRVSSAVKAAPVDAAKERVNQAGDAIADSWSTVRAQALDALGRFEPQATAAIKVARENPVWTALVVGAVGALVGSQMLGGKSTVPVEPQSDPSADA